MKKRVLSLALTVAMALSLALPVHAANPQEVMAGVGIYAELSNVTAENVSTWPWVYHVSSDATITFRSTDIYFPYYGFLAGFRDYDVDEWWGGEDIAIIPFSDGAVKPGVAYTFAELNALAQAAAREENKNKIFNTFVLSTDGFAGSPGEYHDGGDELVIVFDVKSTESTNPEEPEGDFEIENGVLKKYKGRGGSVTIPDDVTSIGRGAFMFQSSVKEVIIPDSVKIIEDRAFDNCDSLQRIIMTDSVTQIGEKAFAACFELTEIKLSNSIKTISKNMLSSCIKLESVTIPDGVTSIDTFAIQGCTMLSSVTIPASVTSIGEKAFVNCDALTIYGSAGSYAETYAKQNNIPFVAGSAPAEGEDSDFLIGNGVLTKYKGQGGTVVIPDNVTKIAQSAFANCEGLTNVVFNSSLTQIESQAFMGCSNLTSVTIPGNVTTIGEGAFSYCANLSQVTLLDGVKTIEWQAFRGCGSLTGVTLPDSVTNIGDSVFLDCTSLTSAKLPSGSTRIGSRVFNGTSLTSVYIPADVVNIGYAVFDGCTGLKDVYYGGTETQWKAIYISTDNAPLTSAKIHYNSPMPENPAEPEKSTTPAAIAATQTVKVDGKDVTFYAYALSDGKGGLTNYVKLRDVAAILNGTKGQFAVGWNGAINLETGKPYTMAGGELEQTFVGDQPYVVGATPVNVNGVPADLEAITLVDSKGGNYNYFKLRDLGQALGFNVGWSKAKGIFIETDKPYDPNN